MFVRVVESGSFSKAARDIGIGQPAVSKQVAALENRLGVQLLTRTSRGLNVTTAGQDFYESALRILGEFEDAEERIGRHQLSPSGLVRVTASPAFGRMYVIPRLAEFRERYPDVSIDLEVSERRVDLIEEGIDVAIRMGNLADSSLTAQRIGTMRVATVASAAYLERNGTPSSPAGLADHQRIAYVYNGEPISWGFRGPAGPITVEAIGAFRTNDTEHLRAAVLAGLGIAHNASWLYADVVASGEVVPLLTGFAPDPFPIHAVTAAGRRMPCRVRLFVDFLAEICAGVPELAVS